MKQTKIKHHRLPLSRVFPATHPRKGERTFFREKLLHATQYYPVQCLCGWIGTSEDCNSYQIGQSGDYSDPTCPMCENEVTDFNCGMKLHTIRENSDYWIPRIEEVMRGEAVLDVYEWTGAPYRSKANTLFTFTKDSGIGWQIISFDGCEFMNGWRAYIKSKDLYPPLPLIQMIAKNDGLSLQDFKDWFVKSDLSKPKIIIHFTNFRY